MALDSLILTESLCVDNGDDTCSACSVGTGGLLTGHSPTRAAPCADLLNQGFAAGSERDGLAPVAAEEKAADFH